MSNKIRPRRVYFITLSIQKPLVSITHGAFEMCLDLLRWDVLWILKTVQKNIKYLLKMSIFITCWNNIFGYLGKLLKTGRKKIHYYIIKNIYMARSRMYWENKFTDIPNEMKWDKTELSTYY